MTTKRKWTGGEWVVQRLTHCDDELWLQIGTADGFGPIMETSAGCAQPREGEEHIQYNKRGTQVLGTFRHLVTPNEEQIANAHLLAASKKLFEALEVAMDIIKEECRPDQNPKRMKDIRAALQAALGEPRGPEVPHPTPEDFLRQEGEGE